jgi:tRNA threonylcarbamoyladenosine biosynthesis protein TsaE
MSIFDQLRQGLVTDTAAKTQSIAAKLAAVLPENQVLKLSGTLGTGKTTFVKGLAKSWDINESVKSPTFNLYSIYQGSRQLVHFDAYRLTDPSQAEDLLIEEFLRPPFCLAIEWPEKVEGWMEENVWHLQFSIDENRSHKIVMTGWPS